VVCIHNGVSFSNEEEHNIFREIDGTGDYYFEQD
jgi:hypothetical protein